MKEAFRPSVLDVSVLAVHISECSWIHSSSFPESRMQHRKSLWTHDLTRMRAQTHLNGCNRCGQLCDLVLLRGEQWDVAAQMRTPLRV
jgi:hypothetical protein